MSGILFNSDGGAGALYHFEPPITPDQLCNVVDQLRDTQVDVFIQSVNFGNDRYLHPTKVAEVFDAGAAADGKFDHDNFRKWGMNVQSLLDRGLDPLEILAVRTHELGMQFWPSMRMNDIHHDNVERCPSLRSRWQIANELLMIGPDVPDSYARRYHRQFSWAMDYGREEVRDRKFALIEEMCAGYDVDGFEMDFLSHPMLFRKGREADGLEILTGFMRRVRQRLDEIGREKGKRLTLLARVLPNFAECTAAGMDVKTWIDEGLVDVLQPQTRGSLDMNADIRSFVDSARDSSARIAAGMEHYVKDYGGGGRATLEMLRAASAGFYEQNAACIYLFNFDCHAEHHFQPISPGESQALREIGSAETLRCTDKHYFVTRDMTSLLAEEGGDKQLPTNLPEQGARRTFAFVVGDDVDSARAAGLLKSLTLKLTFRGDPEGKVHTELNGRELPLPSVSKDVFTCSATFPDPPLGRGKNEIALTLTRPGGVIVEGIEIKILYNAPST